MNSSEPRAMPGWIRGPALIWLFFAVCGCLNAGLPWLIEWVDSRNSRAILLSLGWAGVVCGECCFVVLLSGFGGRNWLEGFFQGVAILSFLALTLLLNSWLMGETDIEALAVICMLPAFLLSAAGPLYGLVTAQGILSAGFAGVDKLMLVDGQFSAAELRQLEQSLSAELTLGDGQRTKVD